MAYFWIYVKDVAFIPMQIWQI